MGPINSLTADSARKGISQALAALSRGIQTEIQDHGEFLLVRIEKEPSASESETAEILSVATSILTELIPPRRGEYAWMVSVERRGTLLDSEFGGRGVD
jgi:hypothetical protein